MTASVIQQHDSFRDKILAYLQVEDLTQLIFIRQKNHSENQNQYSAKKVQEPPTVKFNEIYELVRILGAGGFGVVCEVICKQTKRALALKITMWNEQKPSSAALSLQHEYRILSQTIKHPNIIQVCQNRMQWENYFVMEMELGYETLQQLRRRKKLSELECAKIMKGVFSALAYLHDELNFIHRDLKPENIVLMDSEDLTKVKLIDFGLAVKSTKLELQDYAKCGTLLYTPPEQVLNNFAYAKKADMWAAGIITYELIFGKHPMEESTNSRTEMEERLKNYTSIKFPTDQQSSSVSLQAKHLISQLLQKSISGRFAPSDALVHPWITQKLTDHLPFSRKELHQLETRNYEIEQKLRTAVNVLVFCAITRKHSGVGSGIDNDSVYTETTKEDNAQSVHGYKQKLVEQSCKYEDIMENSSSESSRQNVTEDNLQEQSESQQNQVFLKQMIIPNVNPDLSKRMSSRTSASYKKPPIGLKKKSCLQGLESETFLQKGQLSETKKQLHQTPQKLIFSGQLKKKSQIESASSQKKVPSSSDKSKSNDQAIKSEKPNSRRSTYFDPNQQFSQFKPASNIQKFNNHSAIPIGKQSSEELNDEMKFLQQTDQKNNSKAAIKKLSNQTDGDNSWQQRVFWTPSHPSRKLKPTGEFIEVQKSQNIINHPKSNSQSSYSSHNSFCSIQELLVEEIKITNPEKKPNLVQNFRIQQNLGIKPPVQKIPEHKIYKRSKTNELTSQKILPMIVVAQKSSVANNLVMQQLKNYQKVHQTVIQNRKNGTYHPQFENNINFSIAQNNALFQGKLTGVKITQIPKNIQPQSPMSAHKPTIFQQPSSQYHKAKLVQNGLKMPLLPTQEVKIREIVSFVSQKAKY